MKFDQALQLMKKGDKMKLPSWGGYWCWDNEKKTVMMHMRGRRSYGHKGYPESGIHPEKMWHLMNGFQHTKGNCTVLGGTPLSGLIQLSNI